MADVIGSDGRRVLRGVDRQHAEDFAAQLTARTGEALTVTDDQAAAQPAAEAETAAPAPAPRRRKRTP